MSAGASIADLLEQTNKALAGTDARVYRRVAAHLQRTSAALQTLEEPPSASPAAMRALMGAGSFQKQTVASLRRLCKEHGLKGTSKLGKTALAKLLEDRGVPAPPSPLESYSKKELIAMVRQLQEGLGVR